MRPKRIFLDYKTLRPRKARPRHVVKLCVLGFFIVLLAIDFYRSQYTLTVARYTVASSKITNPLTVVQLSDLHSHSFGKDNQRLIRLVAEQKPDLIVITGDMLTYTKKSAEVPVSLVENLCRIAPVFYGFGNHEERHEWHWGSNLLTDFTEAGATVVEMDFIDVEIVGNRIRIGGSCGYLMPGDLPGWWEPQQHFMDEFCNTDSMKILLAHRPESLIQWGGMQYYDMDITFSGHLHGGQIRLPLIGGLFTPESGFFPKYTKGMFRKGNGTLILSSGLGSGGIVPRLNNIPEIVCVKIISQ